MIRRMVDIQLTPQELARLFCDMGADEQVDFFVHVASTFKHWAPYNRDRQMLAIGKEMLAAGEFVCGFVREFAAAPAEGDATK